MAAQMNPDPRHRPLIDLKDWLIADTEQRATWLEEGATIGRDANVLSWAMAFRRAGATITEEHMLALCGQS